ncbi:MAG: DnaD domain protein [Chloroflexota bacterium]
MARSLEGFADRLELVPVPAAFLGALLRDVHSLAELKLTLIAWRHIHAHRGSPKLVRSSELLADRALLEAITTNPDHDPARAVSDALTAAVARGTFVTVDVRVGEGADTCVLLNTAANRRIVQEAARGVRALGPFEPVAERPEARQAGGRGEVFELYEQNIGLLTPLVAEEIREAQELYPADWIADALREAAANNKRSWRYVQRILENWSARGRGSNGAHRRHAGTASPPRSYLEGSFGRIKPR